MITLFLVGTFIVINMMVLSVPADGVRETKLYVIRWQAKKPVDRPACKPETNLFWPVVLVLSRDVSVDGCREGSFVVSVLYRETFGNGMSYKQMTD